MDFLQQKLKCFREFSLLYSAYCCSSISDQLWSFAMIFILDKLGGIRLVCINQLLESISAIFLSTYIGNWMGKNDRLHATLTVLTVNNLAIVASAFCLIVCMYIGVGYLWIYIFCLIFSILTSALSRCASEGEKIMFTKDWIVVLSQKEDGNTLSIIGHVASLITSIFASYLIVYLGHLTASCVFVFLNLVSWVIERFLLSSLYEEVSELHTRHSNKENSEPDIDLSDDESYWIVKMARIFWRQSTFPIQLCLVFAFMTVLGFDGIPISYGKANQLPDDLLGLFKGAASLTAIFGAFLYTFLERSIGVEWTGLIGASIHQLLNFMCVLSIYLPGSIFDFGGLDFHEWKTNLLNTFNVDLSSQHSWNNTESIAPKELMAGINWSTLSVNDRPIASILVFFTGITLARVGVWMMDLSVLHLMQESISETERMTVFGIENSLCQFFSVCKDLIVIMMPDHRLFGLLIWMSVTFVFAGYLHYVYYFIKTCKSAKTNTKNLLSGKEHELEKLNK